MGDEEIFSSSGWRPNHPCGAWISPSRPIRVEGFCFRDGVNAIDRFVDNERSVHLESRSNNGAYRLVIIDY